MDSIKIDKNRDVLFDAFGIKRLRDSYMLKTESSPQERFAYVAARVGTDKDHAQRLYDYASKHWLSFSTPILSLGRTNHGLPISCYLAYLADTSKGLLETLTEVNQLSMVGGGVGIGVKIRSSDDKSTGVMAHMNTYDASCLAYKQDGVRRGSYAMYLDIDHPDIIQFIDMRKATGDQNIRCLNLHHGINISDKFMHLIDKCQKAGGSSVDDSWDLIDPHTRLTKKTVSARELWQRLLETRLRTGEPYLCFIDTCNRLMPPFQYDKGLRIHQSNLCCEIILPTNEERTAVCCLSSLNIEKYDEWRDDPMFIYDTCEMLDNALTLFINTTPPGLWRARNGAEKDRSIGIGALGWHAYLQSHMISMESLEARKLNIEIFSNIRQQVDKATLKLGSLRGEPEDAIGTGRRFCCTIAIAPNATSSIIMGNTSPSIEPFRANAYRQDTMSGSNLNKNRYLNTLLMSKHVDLTDTWNKILMDSGSVSRLSCLTPHEKAVFKTAFEIDQQWLLTLAADRQQYIDQSQSLNLFLPANVNVSLLNALHLNAWKLGLKTVYYLRSNKITQVDKLGGNKLEEENVSKSCPMRKPGEEYCVACE